MDKRPLSVAFVIFHAPFCVVPCMMGGPAASCTLQPQSCSRNDQSMQANSSRRRKRSKFSSPTHEDQPRRPEDHQDGTQPPYPPQHLFFTYVPWPVSRHSEPLIPETDESRLSAHVAGRPRPPRRLQLQRKVTTQSSKWEIAHF